MRLTLRTLLAYMDGILEPEDLEDLRAKIEHSEFANDLLHRARDVMRRLRLGAPGVLDPREGTDANSVAEYLDNTMPPEQVADFERLCLESDVPLAEVASCHQILTMVLGEPAYVRPEARARMYDIPAQADLLAMQRTETDDGAPPVELARAEMPQIDVQSKPLPQVPDYLRESFLQRHGGKLAIAAAILIGGMVYLFWPAGEVPVPREVARNGVEDQVEVPSVDEGEGEPDEDAAGDATTDAENGELAEPPLFEPGATEEDAEAATTETEAADSSEIPPLPPALAAQADIEGVEASVSADKSAQPDGEIRLPGDAATPPADGQSLPPQPPLPTVQPDTSTTVDAATTVAGGAATSGVPAAESGVGPDVAFDEHPQDATAEETTPTTTVVDPAERTEPEHVATYISGGEMLLRFDRLTEAWIRLAPLAQLREGIELLALPASRPFINLPATNLSVQLEPATRIVLAAQETGELPNLGGGKSPAGLTILYGRVVLFNPDQSGNWVTLRLRLGEVYGVELDGGASVALDVRRILPPGVDPTQSTGELVADVYATSSAGPAKGQVRWLGGGNITQSIDTPAHWQIAGERTGPVQPLLAEPAWIKWGSISDTDALAAKDVEPAMKVGQPAQLSLVELAAKPIMRRREVKSLATRASVHVGDFEPFVKALNDTTQNQVWDDHIATLRSAMALAPQVAEQIRDAFRDYKGQASGDELFRLLWGYSQAQLESGALAELIEYLDHESLDFRVLAFNNLRRATGGKGLDYSPHDQPNRREGPIREWRKRLMQDDLAVRPEGTG